MKSARTDPSEEDKDANDGGENGRGKPGQGDKDGRASLEALTDGQEDGQGEADGGLSQHSST